MVRSSTLLPGFTSSSIIRYSARCWRETYTPQSGAGAQAHGAAWGRCPQQGYTLAQIIVKEIHAPDLAVAAAGVGLVAGGDDDDDEDVFGFVHHSADDADDADLLIAS
jgi:hypothetical protein